MAITFGLHFTKVTRTGHFILEGRKDRRKMTAMDIEQDDSFWDECQLVGRDPGMVSGAPVVKNEAGQLTRLPADTLVENVEGFMELSDMTEDAAIEATLEQFPGTPGGKDTIRALLAYQAAHSHQLQP
jgi:hypothetical protein